jgi:hypothetical protein
VTNRANVYVWFGTFKLFLSHGSASQLWGRCGPVISRAADIGLRGKNQASV